MNILVFRIFAINLINSLIRSSKICCSHEFGNSFGACTFLFPERTKKRKIRRKTRTLREQRESEATVLYAMELNIHSESFVPN